MQAKGRRRGFKSWFVEPYRQVKLGLVFLVINLIFAVLILSIFGFYVWDIYQAIETYFQLSGLQAAETMGKLETPLIIVAGLVGIFVICTILASVRYTHEIYGPLVSIHRQLDDILEGHSTKPLQLRESDQLKELAIKLNLLTERVVHDQRQGALTSVHKFLDEILAGQKPEALKVRQTDPYHSLAAKLNQVVEKVNL